MRPTELFHAPKTATAGAIAAPGVFIRQTALIILFAAVSAAQSLSITTSALPNGTVGAFYASAISASGGTAPYTWSESGSLPPGLSFSSNTAASVISGTPTSGGTYSNIAITVRDSAGASASKTYSIVIGGGSSSGGGTTLAVATTSLPAAAVGQPYSQTLSATGGTPPYIWSGAQALNAEGLTLGSNGTISGTPTASGSFPFTVQVNDSNRGSASANLTLTVTGSTLQITGPVGSLFNGTVGVAYTQTQFTASGGTPPYSWLVISGNTDGLTLDPATGILSGTPQTDGNFTFAAQVTDSTGTKVSQSFSLTVNKPSLVITASSFPAGTVGVAYSQSSPAAVASGGTAPYTWSVVNPQSLPPGLTFQASSVSLSGTPQPPAGTYTFTLQVSDASGLTATKSFSVTIQPTGLTITTSRQLPAATLNVAYSQQMTANGGTPPYSWSANGLPKGLSIGSSTGLISGVPTAAGPFPIIVITVIDSTLKSYQDNFSLTVNLPTVPAMTVSGLPASVAAASQYPLQVAISSPYSVDITGQLIIGFQASTGLGDSTIQFSTGGKTANFTIPAGSTNANFVDSNNVPVSQLQIQTGTVAGSITVSLASVTAGGIDITPSPAPSIATQIAPAAPVISSVLVTRNGSNGCPSGQLCIQVTGYATSREVTQAVYAFQAASGQSLQSSAGSITVDVTSVFTTWFASSTIGSQFILSQPFTIQGDPTQVVPVSVSLTNRLGTTTYTISQ